MNKCSSGKGGSVKYSWWLVITPSAVHRPGNKSCTAGSLNRMPDAGNRNSPNKGTHWQSTTGSWGSSTVAQREGILHMQLPVDRTGRLSSHSCIIPQLHLPSSATPRVLLDSCYISGGPTCDGTGRNYIDVLAGVRVLPVQRHIQALGEAASGEHNTKWGEPKRG